ncbi:hypothetical protein BS50DRAFT_616892 [Corynespora cassiicola Philippines]|uniref:Uncharacterized protein n=1 Tax=Corynespora cassiicola Philippines TaxID=1448308 RepID=A0A2T2P7L0_CORCC|nr:hypothetical protein BS50DRAFT_616892 [Corynespora cassiicola Philippines]
MASFGSAIITSPLLLLLKIVLIISEHLFIKHEENLKKRWQRLTVHNWLRASAAVMAFCVILLWGVTFQDSGNTPSTITDCNNADADIVGDGIRIATWIQEGVLFLVTLYGTGNKTKTAAKELGAGLIIIHVSLSVALMVSFGRKELFIVDAMLGSMILDAQSNTLSVQLATKDTLAARWQVLMVLLAQFFGLVVQGILMGSFSYGGFEMKECQCFSLFWWAWLNNCSPNVRREMIPLWLYYSLRFLSFVYHASDSIGMSKSLDELEKEEYKNKETPCQKSEQNTLHTPGESDGNHRNPAVHQSPEQQNGGSDTTEIKLPKPNEHVCSGCGQSMPQTVDGSGGSQENTTQHQSPNPHSADSITAEPVRESTIPVNEVPEGTGLSTKRKWGDIPATTTFIFLEFSACAILSMFSAEITMGEHNIEKSSPVHSIGQVTALVVACTTGVRAFWVFAFQIKKEYSKKNKQE